MREPGYHPVHAHRETGGARLKRTRWQTADRMVSMRARWREAGRPDPATLDRAIVDAIRAILMREPEDKRMATFIDPDALILETGRHLIERSEKAKAKGRDVTVYRRTEVAKALQARLLAAPSPASSCDAERRC